MKKGKIMHIRDITKHTSVWHTLYEVKIKIEIPRKIREAMFYFQNMIKDWQCLTQALSSAIMGTSEAQKQNDILELPLQRVFSDPSLNLYFSD